MTKANRTYGFRVTTDKWAGVDCITIRVLAREGQAASPINPHLDGESRFYGAPKRTEGLMLSRLTIRAYASDYRGGGPVIVRSAEFEDVSYVKSEEAKAMLKTFARIDRVLRDRPRAAMEMNVADYVEAVAEAIGATWFAREVRKHEWSSSYSDSGWAFEDLATLKAELYVQQAALEAAHAAKFPPVEVEDRVNARMRALASAVADKVRT
jgi:hypothetical protein